MKKVTIPTCANPFVVKINGKEYSYPAGTEQEVPDEVAFIIEQHHEAHEEEYQPTEAPFGLVSKKYVEDIVDEKLAKIINAEEVAY